MKELELSKSNVAHDLPDLTAEEMEEMKSNETTVAEDRFLQDVEEGNLPDLDLLGQSTNAVDEPAFNISATAAADPSAQVESTEQHATSWLQEVALSHKLEAHLDQVTENLRDAHYAIVRQAQLLLNDVTATTALVNTSEIAYVNTSNFYRRVGEINEAVLQLSKCAVQKSFELRSTALLSGSHGRSDGASLSPLVEARLASKPWTTCVGGGGGAALTLLSDIYQSIRALEQGGRAVEDVWVAPQSFERATQKYWVNEEHLSEVLLACVAQVPLLVFGK